MSVPRSLRDEVSRELGVIVSNIKFLVPSRSGGYAKYLTSRGVSHGEIYTDLPTAYAALTANQNDALVVMPGSYTVTSAFEWGKDYTHMLGNVAAIPMNQRARVSSTTAALSPLITFSADGSVMKNIMWSQDGSHATTAAINCLMTGDRNRLENITFRNLGALAYVDDSMRNLKITSSNGENYYLNCTIGTDSIDMVTGAGVAINYAGTETARDVFERCRILSGGSANGTFLTIANSATTAFIEFRDCLFQNNILGSMDPLTQGFSIGTPTGYVLLTGTTTVNGAATLETSNSGMILGMNAIAAATSNTSVALTF